MGPILVKLPGWELYPECKELKTCANLANVKTHPLDYTNQGCMWLDGGWFCIGSYPSAILTSLAYFEKAHEMVSHKLKLFIFVINDEPHFNSMLVAGWRNQLLDHSSLFCQKWNTNVCMGHIYIYIFLIEEANIKMKLM